MKIRIGTRGSLLATTQTNWVGDKLRERYPELEIEIVPIRTKGDLDQTTSLDKIGDKGIFVREIEEALLEDNIDLAIHSMKDMPSDLPDGLMFGPVLEREDPRDVLITPHKIQSFKELPANAKIGTGSKRRSSQLIELLPTVEVLPIRGNVDTRIRKMFDEEMDGIVVAKAGINRLGLKSNDQYTILTFEVDEMIPAPAQGILAIELKESRRDLITLLMNLKHTDTQLQADVERRFLSRVNGGCHSPVGAYLDITEDQLTFMGLYGDEEGNCLVRTMVTCTESDVLSVVEEVAKDLVGKVNK